jgi:isopentenyl-diphosphate Delta-isomerase
MSALIDVLSETGLRTGETLPRAEIHRLGKRHRVVRLYLFNAQNELLLQRRAMTVDHAPNLYSISVLGHINAGEFSAQTVRREVEEELGIDASQLKIDFLFSHYQEAVLNETYIDRQFNDIYVTRADLDPAHIQFDSAEVAEIKFVPFDDFRAMLADESSLMARVYGNECRDLAYFLNNM